MILVDTSIWVDHFHTADLKLVALLNEGRVLIHPFVIGELAVGNLRQRDIVLWRLQRLTQATVASDWEVLGFIRQHRLYGIGVGFVDCHLMASVRVTPGAAFWTRDKRLAVVAERFGVGMSLDDQ